MTSLLPHMRSVFSRTLCKRHHCHVFGYTAAVDIICFEDNINTFSTKTSVNIKPSRRIVKKKNLVNSSDGTLNKDNTNNMLNDQKLFIDLNDYKHLNLKLVENIKEQQKQHNLLEFDKDVTKESICETLHNTKTDEDHSLLSNTISKTRDIKPNIELDTDFFDSKGKITNAIRASEWTQENKPDIWKLPEYYMKLSKIRLTGLVVVTTMAGYGIAPMPFDLQTFAFCTLGTGLCSASANTVNQFLEVPYDSQMKRTKNRVLVTGKLSPLHAVGFATVTGITGLSILALGVNPITCVLGATNLAIYTLMYTPLKRLSVINTWVGSVVGAIPPVMGWAACTGSIDAGAILLAAIMYSWQFPHFNALSWNLRPDYSRSGYRMTSVIYPDLCKRVALRHCIALTGMCSIAPAIGVTTWAFAVDSLPFNLYLTYLGWRFYRDGDSNSSRKLFRFTLLHIPILFTFMLISRQTQTSEHKSLKQALSEYYSKLTKTNISTTVS